MEPARSNPDQLLKAIKQDTDAGARGHLKIFFGYAAGVGKTYAMLEAARAARKRGVDVVVGYVEPHTRADTLALLDGLEQIPALETRHKGVLLREFDLDAALARRAQLVLVDELAHANAAGCRHAKRYQDIKELLKSGVNVYTTVNVQHIESLNDMIAAITGVAVRERIPDSVLDGAAQVELVDIEPEELLERLHAGKIYGELQAQKALANFFTLKNLTALREIALRRCADRVNQLSEKARLAARDGYYTDEHILVCLSSSPTNPKIIRTAARMAKAFKGNFTALFVESTDFSAMSEDNKKRLHDNIRLARRLGASVETVCGDDVPFQISEFARLSGVSKIVMGRSSVRRRYFWNEPSLTERLIAYAPALDIHIIPDQSTPAYRGGKARPAGENVGAADILKSMLILLAATLIGVGFQRMGSSEANIITVYILGVLLTAVWTSRRIYSMASSLVSVLTFNYFFTQPFFNLRAYGVGYPVTFLVMLLSAFITSTLAVRMKRRIKQASEAAYRTKILLETNQLIQKAGDRNKVVFVVANQLIKLMKRDIAVYLTAGEALSMPELFLADGAGDASVYTTPNEQSVAAWVYKNNKRAGATTDTLSGAKCLYLAIRAGETVHGVVGIAAPDGRPLDTFESDIMLSILGECALALDNEAARQERQQSALLAKNEQLRANLLRAISHDLRTPLTSISGNAEILLASSEQMSPTNRKKLYGDMYDDSMWLVNLVENLLSVTRIEDNVMRLSLSAELIDDVIAEALRHLGRGGKEHTITVRPMEGYTLALIDVRLILQVIINIVGNAVKYTPPGSTIVIGSRREGDQIIVEIADDGDGIPDEAKAHIFEMFYTVKNGIADSRRSLGLGLALCKSIIEAHGGEIFVADNQPRGTVFKFTLPVKEVALRE